MTTASTPAPPADPTVAAFAHDSYLIRRKVFKLFGGAFHVYGPDDQLVMYSKLKAFKLKEDIRVYTDESMTTELLTIQATKILDISSAYNVIDPISGERVGALRRKGMKSFIQDEWLILDADHNEIGMVQEDSTLKALLRRFVDFVALLMPQAYTMTVGGAPVGEMKQNFNPFVMKINVDFSQDTDALLDRRLGLAAAILMCAIEGKQS